jgi:hypothetical protein
MLEPERVDAGAKALYDKLRRESIVLTVSEWEENREQDVKSIVRVAYIEAYQAFMRARPGFPCIHDEYWNTGRCASMSCSNYIEKHRHKDKCVTTGCELSKEEHFDGPLDHHFVPGGVR